MKRVLGILAAASSMVTVSVGVIHPISHPRADGANSHSHDAIQP